MKKRHLKQYKNAEFIVIFTFRRCKYPTDLSAKRRIKAFCVALRMSFHLFNCDLLCCSSMLNLLGQTTSQNPLQTSQNGVQPAINVVKSYSSICGNELKCGAGMTDLYSDASSPLVWHEVPKDRVHGSRDYNNTPKYPRSGSSR